MKLLMENWRAHLKEHRGTPCSEAPAVERMECEKRTKELEKERAHRRKKKNELHPGKAEMDSLGHGVVEGSAKKPQCSPGNKNHDTNGKFSSVGNSTSWSDNNPSGKSDCVSGQYRKKGTTKKTWTKIRCGRKKDNTGKAKHKCKDGSPAYQEALEQAPEENWVKIKRADLDMLLELVEDETKDGLLVEPVLEEVESNLNKDQVKSFCNSNGYNNMKQWLNRMNAIELSQKGDLNKKD